MAVLMTTDWEWHPLISEQRKGSGLDEKDFCEVISSKLFVWTGNSP